MGGFFMEDNNGFVQKVNYSKNSNGRSIGTIIITSFISAIVGGACALGIFFGLNDYKLTNASNLDNQNTISKTNYENLNLEQVSLSNYSDTAIYAANKVLPSMVSITVEYDISFMGRTRNNNRFWFWSNYK